MNAWNISRHARLTMPASVVSWLLGSALGVSGAVVTNLNIVDFAFNPSSVTIQVDDQVKWTWTGGAPHSTTSDSSLWDSGIHSAGFTFTQTFSSAGTFPFHCSVHPFMTGSIVVQGGTAGNVAPAIVTQPQSQTVAAGQDVTFTVSATGTPAPSYQWRLQGMDLAGATGSSLMLHSVQPSDAGSYSVVVSNVAGMVTSSIATLTVSSSTAVLTVTIAGQGSVEPDYNGQMLVLGANYTMTAVPEAGYVFGSWTGTLSTNSPTLTFQMQSNLVLQANFLAATGNLGNVQGSYSGLFFETNAVALPSSGSFTLAVTAQGAFSGTLRTAARRSSFSGRFDTGGTAQVTAMQKGLNPLTVNLRLDPGSDVDAITGTVGDGAFTAQLAGDRAVYNSRTNAAPQAGLYTATITGNPDSTTKPGGDSSSTLTVAASGKIKFIGSLADGTKITQTAVLLERGQWPLFVALPKSHGCLVSWVTVNPASPSNAVSGALSWIKPPVPGDKHYPGGFQVDAAWTGAVYARPPARVPVLSFSDATLVLEGGGLTQAITNEVTLGSNNRVTAPTAGHQLSLTFKPASGSFSGKFMDPATGKPMKITGVALQPNNTARGCFLGSSLSGRVLLQPR
jgi:plastocyanin